MSSWAIIIRYICLCLIFCFPCNSIIQTGALWDPGITTAMAQVMPNRKQISEINNSLSTFQNASCGISQGSSLGPLLLLIAAEQASLKRASVAAG